MALKSASGQDSGGGFVELLAARGPSADEERPELTWRPIETNAPQSKYDDRRSRPTTN